MQLRKYFLGFVIINLITACSISEKKLELPTPLRTPIVPNNENKILIEEQQEQKLSNRYTDSPKVVEQPFSQSSGQQPTYPAFKKNQPSGLNVDNIPLSAFINEVFGNILGLSFQLHPDLQKRPDLVTLRVSELKEPSELYDIVKRVLNSYGIGLSQEGDVLKVIPITQSQSGEPPLLVSGRTLPEVPVSHRPIFQYVPLKIIAVSQIAPFIKGLQISPQLQIYEEPQKNALFLAGPPSIISQALDYINFLDRTSMKGRYTLTVQPFFITADELAKSLEDVLKTEGYAVGIGSAAPATSVVLLPVRSNSSLVIFSADQNTLDHVKQWIDKLDHFKRSSQHDGLFIYQVQHIQSKEIESLLGPLLATIDGVGTTTPEVPKSTDNKNPIPPTPATTPTNTKTSSQATTLGKKIVVDKQRNQLLFRGKSEEWARLIPILKMIDRPTKQVLIEVMIAEITLSDGENFGVNWALGGNNLGKITGATSGITGGTNGLTYTLINSLGETRATLNTLASNSRVNVLSSPRVMVKSGEAASINVGDQVPVVTSRTIDATTGQTSGTSNASQNIQYRTTGTQLSITPIVYAGNRVDIDINQSVSRAIPDSTGLSPTINDRTITTKLTLTDGGSVLLGGLIENTYSDSNKGIPLLKDIPVLGHLFRSSGQSTERRELIMLIVPYVVNDENDAQQLTQAFRHSLHLEEHKPIIESPKPAVLSE
jgi:general secretion pathway protein D